MQPIENNSHPIADLLIAYLREAFDNPQIDYLSPPKQLQGGYETDTYHFQLKGAGEALPQRLVLRLYPPSYGTQNAVWESTLQNILANEGYPAARAHVICTDLSILGGAFFVMDHIPGQMLMFADPRNAPSLFGEIHAQLHNIDPQPLIERLNDLGVDPYAYSFDSRLDWCREKAGKYAWMGEITGWLIDNRPAESGERRICHGDFHPLNILVDDGRVTGVLDWPGFAIAEPAFDVATSLVLTTISARHHAASMAQFAAVDWDAVAEMYLTAYQRIRPLDPTNLDYYKVRRCAAAIIQGIEGQSIWQHPAIVRDLAAYIFQVTGISINIPAGRQ